MTDPWTVAGVFAQVLDIVSRLGRRLSRDGDPTPDLTEGLTALPLRSGWDSLPRVELSGASWQPQIPRWGTLLAHDYRPEPPLVDRIRDDLFVAGPLCPTCSAEMVAGRIRVPFGGRRWRCESCGHRTWLNGTLPELTAAIARRVRVGSTTGS